MKLLFALTTLKRNGANQIHVILTYMAYARQDRPVYPHMGCLGPDTVNMIKGAGANSLSVFDIHCEQTLQSAYLFPTTCLNTTKLIDKVIELEKFENPVIVSPDAGGLGRVKAFLKSSTKEYDMAVMDKTRKKANEVANIVLLLGEVKGRDCVVVDDMIDTGVS